MDSLCTEEKNLADNQWYRIIQDMLSKTDIRINGSRPWDIQVKNNDLFKRVLQEGSLGLGESYMDGWWECEQLDTFFYYIAKHEVYNQLPFHILDTLRMFLLRLINLQSKTRAWSVGRQHYDLGNDLFTRILDPHMQYSCGYWKAAQTLEQAQEAKMRLICEKLHLAPGMCVLDIGCGWGGLAAFAARHYDVTVTGITISKEQKKMAEQRCTGLDVTILLRDYRDMNGQFDRIVCIGMFEHVGPKNYATFFSMVNSNLKPNGIFLLHTIGSNTTDENLDAWTFKYIFPNGCLPSVLQIATASEPNFIMEDLHSFGTDYDLTLMAWYQRFLKAWPELADKYSARFKRMFTYYLNSCAGTFRARRIQLWQIVFSRGREERLQVPH